MARLSDHDVTSLIGRLRGEQAPLDRAALGQRSSRSNERDSSLKAQEARERLRVLSSDGSLGPLLTQRLAAYLGKPIRCTSGDIPGLPGEGPFYKAHANGVQLWVQLDTLLASALADAMIGGDGDAPKVGYGSKVARTAAGAVTEMLGVIAQALQLPEPTRAALEPGPHLESKATAGGGFSVAMRDYSWQAGILESALPQTADYIEPMEPLKAPVPAAPATVFGVQAAAAGSIEAALERARQGLEEMLGRGVAFESVQTETLTAPRVPLGWLGISLTPRGGRTIVLAVNRATEVALVRSALAADLALEAGGVLMETGAEVILRGALVAFAAELSGGSDEIHHIVRLSDNAVLAELPHMSVVHRVVCDSHSGVLRWLVPERH
jgi:hypothetical protein